MATKSQRKGIAPNKRSGRTATVQIRLPRDQIAVCNEIAALSGLTVNDVFNFFIACEIVRLRLAGVLKLRLEGEDS